MKSRKNYIIFTLVATAFFLLVFFIVRDIDRDSRGGDTAGEILNSKGLSDGEQDPDTLPEAKQPDLERPFTGENIHPVDQREAIIRDYWKIVGELKENFTSRNNWLQIALYRNLNEDYEGARDIWLYTTQVWPLDHVSFGNLAGLYANYLPEYGEAEKYYIEAIARRRDNFQYYLDLYNLYRFKLNNPRKALDFILSANSDFPNELSLLVRIAEHYRDVGMKVEAGEFFQKARAQAKSLGDTSMLDYIESEIEDGLSE